MRAHLTRSATVIALAASLGLVALPACKKSKPTEATRPNPDPGAGIPSPGPAGGGEPMAPRGPLFSNSNSVVREPSVNNLKQIGMALHDYHSTHGTFPMGYADKTGKPGLSWRVAILPYIGQDNLFKSFKLDEAWDSPHNKALIDKMPKTFAPNTDTHGYTFYRGFSGPNTWLPHPVKPQPGQPLKGISILQIQDGTSNTILVAEAFEAVIWTKPDELPFDPKNLPKLGGVYGNGFHALMGDGSVRFLRTGISPQTLANAIQINDGNVVNLDN
jgi:Protein of unknown function (DUF1559)